MPIKSERFGPSMDAWVCEKSHHILRNACNLADWLHREGNPLPEDERSILEDFTFDILQNAAKLYIFGNENPDVPLRTWVGLLFLQGRLRLDEFSEVASGKVPVDTVPAEYPASIQRILNLFEDTSLALQNDSDSRTLVRLKLIEFAEALKKQTDKGFSLAGGKLLDLVDNQTYHATLSWEELISESKSIVEQAKKVFIEKVERYRWKQVQESSEERDLTEEI